MQEIVNANCQFDNVALEIPKRDLEIGAVVPLWPPEVVSVRFTWHGVVPST